jgi:hypothetical protein
MLTQLVTGSRAWRANTIDDARSWYYPLSDRCLAAIDQTVAQFRHQPRPTTDLRVSDTPLAACAGDLRPVLAALETGRGFAILSGLPRDRYSVTELQAVYWLLGQLLGRPFEQNVQGALLYDVRDTGQDVRYGARFSVTNAESTFHTDNSFGTDVLDYVGLLCVNAARSGGLNQVVSVYAIHNELLTYHRDMLEVLYRPFHVDRRGGVRPGEPPTVPFPIFRWDGRELTCRYLRYWIEVGHEKAGQPLTTVQVQALDMLDAVARRPDLQVEFGLKPGDMFYINNRWILHNRNAFEDYAEPERKRHLVRLWLKSTAQAR